MEVKTEQQLISDFRSGEQTAFRNIFDRYYRILVITSYQILKDQHISRDAVQEVFLELWKNRDKLKDESELLPYLKRSVINRSINIIKSRKHHMSSGPEPLSFITDDRRQPDQEYEEKELKEVVMTAIDRLPERCRAVFMLCRMEGYSHFEIAAKLGISTKTIENQMTKALKIIRNEIQQYQGLLKTIFITLVLSEWGIIAFELLSCYHYL